MHASVIGSGDVTYPVVSRFLSEISEKYLERETVRRPAYTAQVVTSLQGSRERYLNSIKQKPAPRTMHSFRMRKWIMTTNRRTRSN
jgi:hypothetical protein